MRIGIVGCGLIGHKRAAALKGFPDSAVVIAADTVLDRAQELAASVPGCVATDDWKKATRSKDVDIVFVATIHSALAQIVTDAIKHGKHVLVEKPVGRNAKEILKILKAYEQQHAASPEKKARVKVGLNHRYHPAILKAKEILATGSIGDILFIRASYGHGGRPGYDKEWRAKKELAGGGELLDQGSHLIDLCHVFMGEFDTAVGFTPKLFWDMEVEDNAFVLLKGPKGYAQLHASWTQWKNSFNFQIVCRTGQIDISGLGRSYGQERLTLYRMRPEMGPPDREEFSWPDEDKTWGLEYGELLAAIAEGREPNGNLSDALNVARVIEKVYAWDAKMRAKTTGHPSDVRTDQDSLSETTVAAPDVPQEDDSANEEQTTNDETR